MLTTNLIVSAVNLFSVRSCAGETLQEAAITPNGLTFDRQWRLVTPDGKFLTQRECPKIALVQPRIVQSKLQLRFAASAVIAPACHDNADIEPVRISDSHLGIDQGDDVANWLASVLDTPVRLLRVTDDASSLALDAASNDFARPDMAPVLIISEESLADLNTRLEEPVLMNRFRPNIVVRGGQAYEEDSWTRVVIGDVVYVAFTEPCGRCSMINIDQEKGEKAGREPLKTLATYRRTPAAVIFGKYMVPESCGVVRVGDKISTVSA
jgi:uncharacterized protein YcbX